MAVAWVVTSSPEKHEAFVRELKRVFDGNPSVMFVEEELPPYYKLLEEMPHGKEGLKEWKAREKAMAAPFRREGVSTWVMARFDHCFDDDSIIHDIVGGELCNVAYLLDDEEDEVIWGYSARVVFKMRPGQSIEEFVDELR